MVNCVGPARGRDVAGTAQGDDRVAISASAIASTPADAHGNDSLPSGPV